MAPDDSNEPKISLTINSKPDGSFDRQESIFRSSISRAPGSQFPPEKDRYILYINIGCPWAHRTWITAVIKHLPENHLIQVVFTGTLGPEGWTFDGQLFFPRPKADSSLPETNPNGLDPIYGLKNTKELYLKADPNYAGRYTVPIVWDKKNETIVNNESSEIIRMLYEGFDDLLPEKDRESSKSWGGLLPKRSVEEIDEMNQWVYETINNGVYKSGFSRSQVAYESAVTTLFESLDRVESHLSTRRSKYLFSDHVTEADIRLYTTIARFDVAYHGIFQCNLKMIRHDYPGIDKWYRTLYYDQSEETNGAFGKTTYLQAYKKGYASALDRMGFVSLKNGFTIPLGPKPDILPPP